MSRSGLYLLGAAMFFIGLLFNFGETWYFGWHHQPSCQAEMVCDYISKFLVFGGAFISYYAANIKN